MNILRVLKALGLLVGMIVGAGMFAMPYAVAHAGFFWSFINFALAAFLVTIFHLLYGHVLYHDHTNHRLPGYVRKYNGEGAYWLALSSRLFSYFGYLLAYGVLCGVFIANIIQGANPAGMSILFFLAAAPLLSLNLPQASSINLFLTIPLVLFVVALFAVVAPGFQSENFRLPAADLPWFFPYGIFLFAFSGASIIPEVVEIFRARDRKLFARSVVASTAIVVFIYVLFVAAVIGSVGAGVSQDALSSLRDITGERLFLLGSVIGLLAIITSYIPLGLELRSTLEYDFGARARSAWAAVAFTPLVLYILGINNFITILGVVGAVGVGIEGMFITMLAHKTLKISTAFVGVLFVMIALGALFEITHALGIV